MVNVYLSILTFECLQHTFYSFLDLGLPLWLGGVPAEFPLSSLHQISSRGVTGCIGNVHINGRLLDLNSHLAESNSQSGCGQIDDVCRVSNGLCGKGGVCLPRWEEYQCLCPPQKEGEICDKGRYNLQSLLQRPETSQSCDTSSLAS